MKNAAQLRVITDNCKTVSMRLPIVHNDWKIQFQGKLDLSPEHLLLQFRVLLIPIIIQTDFANCNYLRVFRKFPETVNGIICPCFILLRMTARSQGSCGISSGWTPTAA